MEALHGRFYLLSLADQYLVTWIHTWDAHALATQPAGLFHAGIFHPAPWSLARLDHHLGNALLFAPVYLASGNPGRSYRDYPAFPMPTLYLIDGHHRAAAQ